MRMSHDAHKLGDRDTARNVLMPQLRRLARGARPAFRAAHGTLARADEISRRLLAETMPLSLPDPRWDRLHYPVRDCEAYLRTRAPRI